MKYFGFVIYLSAGIYMLIMQIYWFYQWWGLIAVFLSFIIPPLVVAFPFVYWYKIEFPLFYFIVWIIGLSAVFISAKKTESENN